MAIMSLDQARINSPILTSMAYGIPIQGLVGKLIMPPVPVPKRKCKVIVFGANREKYLYTTRRAPGDNVLRVGTGYGDTEIELFQDALEGEIPVELDEEAEGIVDLQMDAVTIVKTGLAMRLEADIFNLVNNFGAYPATNRLALTAGTQFSNAAVNPIAAFDIANQAVLTGINRMPNTIIYGGLKAFNAVKENPRIRDQIKYVNGSTINVTMLNGILGYPTGAISLASYVLPSNPAVSVPFFDNSIWVGYVPGNDISTNPTNVETTLIPDTAANKRMPAYGYVYTRMAAQVGPGADTGLVMQQPYYGNNNRTWYFPGVVDRVPVVTGMAAGYLFTNVSA